MNKKVLYLDMDGVIVDFESAFPKLLPAILIEYDGRLDSVPGLFSHMDPIEGSIEAVKALTELFDVYILSTVPWGNPTGASDKIAWVKKYFGDKSESPLYKRVILSHNKHLNKGDFLVDDRPAHNGADRFEGELIHFGSERFPDWDAALSYLRSKA